MEDRWWADVGKVPRALKLVGPDSDNRGVGVVWFSLHATGADSLLWLARGTMRSVGQTAHVLQDVDYGFLVNPYRFSTGVSEVDAVAAVERWRVTADAGANSLLSTLLRAKVPFPNALHRVAAVYGLDSKSVNRFAQKVKQPALPPNVLADLGDRALAEYAERVVTPGVDVAFGKAYEIHDVGGRQEQREVNRDEGGKFARKGTGVSARSKKNAERQARQLKAQKRTKATLRSGKKAERVTRQVKSQQEVARLVELARSARKAKKKSGVASASGQSGRSESGYQKLSSVKVTAESKGKKKVKKLGKFKKVERVEGLKRVKGLSSADKGRIRAAVKSRIPVKARTENDPGGGAVSSLTVSDVLTYDLGNRWYDEDADQLVSSKFDVNQTEMVDMTLIVNSAMYSAIVESAGARDFYEHEHAFSNDAGVYSIDDEFLSSGPYRMPNDFNVSFGSLDFVNGLGTSDAVPGEADLKIVHGDSRLDVVDALGEIDSHGLYYVPLRATLGADGFVDKASGVNIGDLADRLYDQMSIMGMITDTLDGAGSSYTSGDQLLYGLQTITSVVKNRSANSVTDARTVRGLSNYFGVDENVIKAFVNSGSDMFKQFDTVNVDPYDDPYSIARIESQLYGLSPQAYEILFAYGSGALTAKRGDDRSGGMRRVEDVVDVLTANEIESIQNSKPDTSRGALDIG